MQIYTLQKFATYDQIHESIKQQHSDRSEIDRKLPVKSNSSPLGSQRFPCKLDMKCLFFSVFPRLNYCPVMCLCVRECGCVRVCRCQNGYVSQPVSEKASVRLSLYLSVFRDVVSSCSHPFPLFPPPIDVIKRVCQSSMRINPRETPSSLPLSLDRLVVTQT